jgi:NitT/TauT family transport system substrate-binding protein
MTTTMSRAWLIAAAALVAGTIGGPVSPAQAQSSQAQAREKVTYLFPAPGLLPAFAPFNIARHKGYYTAEGVEVDFQVGRGGADVAKQVGTNNADLGGGIGDTPIVVRANEVPVKSVAVLGGRALIFLVARNDRNIKGPADLKGKKVTVAGLQDSAYFALLGMLATVNLKKSDLEILPAGPAGVTRLVIAGEADAMMGVPEWAYTIEQGVPATTMPSEQYYQSMAQAILASDETIAKKPQAIRGFVRATLKAMKEVMDNPKQATADFIAAVPQHKGKEAEMEEILTRYAKFVYPGQATLGAMDEQRLKNVQDFMLKEGIIQKATPLAELYTNQFVR